MGSKLNETIPNSGPLSSTEIGHFSTIFGRF
jgi:hypothetical protein